MVSVAIIASSSVGITSTRTGEASLEITIAFWPAAVVCPLRSRSSSMPKHESPLQIRERTPAPCSPIPPVNTTASSPPMAAVYEPMYLRAR